MHCSSIDGYSFRTNDLPQELDFLFVKFSLISLDIQLVVQQALEDLVDILAF